MTFNATTYRLDDNLQGIIDIFSRIFGVEFSRNMVIVVTHWDFSARKAKNFDIPKKVQEFIELFNKFFKFRLTED